MAEPTTAMTGTTATTGSTGSTASSARDPQHVKNLYLELDTKHPDYDAEVEHWKLIQHIMGDTRPDMKSYLPKGALESQDVYEVRVKLAEWVPDSNLSVEKVISAIYKQEPKRDTKKHADLASIMADADLRGTAWGDFIQDVGRILVPYGATRLLCVTNDTALPVAETPTGDAVPRERTRAEEKAEGIRPYFVNYNPLSVINWSCNDAGVLESVMIKEERTNPSKIDRKKFVRRTTFIEYDTQNVRHWIFEEIDGQSIALVDQSERTHGLGLVPMVVVYYRKMIKPMIGDGFLRMAARADLRKIRQESDLTFALYVHAHPTLVGSTKESLGDLGVGTGSYVKLSPHEPADKLEYLQLPTAPFEALKSGIEMNRAAVVHHTGIDPLGVLQAGSSAFQTSGAARAWSFETSEGRILSAVADRMEAVEKRAFEFAVRYQSPSSVSIDPTEPAFQGTIAYSDDFDVAATSALLDDAQKCAMQINSETLLRSVHKRIASAICGEVSAEDMEKISEEIDNNPLIGTQVGRDQDVLDMPRAGGFGDNAGGNADGVLEEDGDGDGEGDGEDEDESGGEGGGEDNAGGQGGGRQRARAGNGRAGVRSGDMLPGGRRARR